MKILLVSDLHYALKQFDWMHEIAGDYDAVMISGDVLDMGVEDRVVQKSGAWFSYGETRLGQGRDKARLFLEENPELLEEIRTKVLTARGFAHLDESPAETPTEATAGE